MASLRAELARVHIYAKDAWLEGVLAANSGTMSLEGATQQFLLADMSEVALPRLSPTVAATTAAPEPATTLNGSFMLQVRRTSHVSCACCADRNWFVSRHMLNTPIRFRSNRSTTSALTTRSASSLLTQRTARYECSSRTVTRRSRRSKMRASRRFRSTRPLARKLS